MKPFRTLKLFQKATDPTDAIKAILKLTETPARHLRGPRFGLRPGTGKIQPTNKEGSVTTAICACSNGLIDVVCRGGRDSDVAQDTRNVLNNSALSLYGPDYNGIQIRSHATVSDSIGLKAFRRILKDALAQNPG